MLKSWDARRDYYIAPSYEEAISFSVQHWIHSAQRAIQQKGAFFVALSGGSTPKAIYAELSRQTHLDWSKVHLFWSDERAVAPNDPESNYHMAMTAGLSRLPIPASQIHRMIAETDIEKNAHDYEEKIRKNSHFFDLIMLGIGEDGHTASLFPNTQALNSPNLVAANYVPKLGAWRMSLTFKCLTSCQTVVYALSSSKSSILAAVLDAPIDSLYPASRLGTPTHKALYILDAAAASKLPIEPDSSC